MIDNAKNQPANTRPGIITKFLSGFKTIWISTSVVLGSLLLLLIIVFVLLSLRSPQSYGEQSFQSKPIKNGGLDKVAVVTLSGQIVQDPSQGGLSLNPTVISSRKTVELLSFLENEDSVKAVVLDINSPGGAVVASDDIYQAVRSLREKKPVIARMGDVAASGGYYISAGADAIVANRSTLTGSIGVIMQIPEISGLYEMIGVDVRTFKSGEYKDITSSTRAFSEEDETILQSLIADSYDHFVEVIVSGREMDEARVRELADGRIYTGKQAFELGLVDSLGNMETALTIASNMAEIEDPTVVEYQNTSFLEALLGATTNAISPTASLNQVMPEQNAGMYYLMDF